MPPRLRIRQHVNPLRAEYQKLRGVELELPARPVEVELGCADARFSLARAAAEPERHFVGIEIREEMAAFVNRVARERGLPNFVAVFANMNRDLPALFARRAVARYHLLFPDPWFKKRHHKRRVVTPELIDDLHATLEPGGELSFASDVWEVALDAMAELEARDDLFTNRAGPWSFWRGEPEAHSKRDLACQRKGWPVWRMRYRKLPIVAGSCRG